MKCKEQLGILFVLGNTNPNYREAYRAKKREYNDLLSKSRRRFYQEKIVNSDNKSKTMWQVVKEVKGGKKTQRSCMLEGDLEAVYNDSNIHFLNTATEEICEIPQQKDPKQNIFPNFTEMSINSVTTQEKIIKNLKNKKVQV
ncbi:hypothetical protein JTB14_005654 [Gonioctena quinquepunctata]|nr:hypothetical protein JTB14_005654 [Gonioctena quinquepunctata]